MGSNTSLPYHDMLENMYVYSVMVVSQGYDVGRRAVGVMWHRLVPAATAVDT